MSVEQKGGLSLIFEFVSRDTQTLIQRIIQLVCCDKSGFDLYF